MRKALVVLALAACFALLVAGIAFATVPNNPEGYWDEDTTATGAYGYSDPQNYTSPTHPSGPHGGYSTSTNKCRECHAVHRASGGWKLTRVSNQWETCDYCHGVSGSGSGVNIAMGDAGVSNGHHLGWGQGDGNTWAPDTESTITPNTTANAIAGGAYLVNPDGFSCFDCHSIHANPRRMVFSISDTEGDWGGFTNNLLLGNPNRNNATGWCGQSPDMSQWCADCHSANYGLHTVTSAYVWNAATRRWATNSFSHDCETDGYTTVGNWIFDTCGGTTDDEGNYAYVNPEDGINDGPKCRQCHSYKNEPLSNSYWPHKSTGTYVLLKKDTTTSKLDSVCLDCHNTLALP